MLVEIDPIDFPSWLAAQDIYPKFYWKCRKTGIETAALGAYKEFFEIPRHLEEKVYGAVSFPSQNTSPLWNDFPTPYFFLPQIEIIQSPLKTRLKVRGSSPVFNTPKTTILDLPSLELHEDFPSFKNWEESVFEVLKAIERKELEKLVLARMSSFKTENPPFSWLKKILDSSINSTVFAFQMNSSSLFLGASPEMLYQRQGRHIQTEAIAGTRKKGSSYFEDQQIGNELQNSIKDQKEIDCVKSFLKDSLSSICEKTSYEPIDSLIETSQLQHLYNRLDGLLRPEIDDFTILSLVHPTPAVGGLPKKVGIEKIHALESFDRGLYAGALGWISPSESSFAVTIRSALCKSGYLHAFAGTGIVTGSDPQKEWNELEDKISHWKTLCPIHH